MHCPSGLKVNPEGTTSPTVDFAQPMCSSFLINWGTTDSDELVPSTVKISSLMYFRNFQRLKPHIRAITPRTTNTKRIHVVYIAAISLPKARIEPKPYLPTVKAIAPNAAIGASRIIMPTIANITCMKSSSTVTKNFTRLPK